MAVMTPIAVDFGEDANSALKKYVKDNISALKESLATLHEQKVSKWRRLYRGVPDQESKNFPWKNASNVIIQLIGENCDIIRARILGTIFETMPLWVTQLAGDWKQEEHGAEQQEAVQEFLNLVGLEPNELDLYRVESQGIDECIKFGTVMYALPWVLEQEAECIGYVEGKGAAFRNLTKYEGPRPEKIKFENWAATPSASTIEAADFKYKVVTLKKQQLEERFHAGIYKFKSTDEKSAEQRKEDFLKLPDRPGPSNQDREANESKGIMLSDGYSCTAEWDIHECWFPYWHNGKKHRLIYSYHLSSDTEMRAIFNGYPKNEEPWEMARFGYSDDGLYGFGLCEMLEHYQKEVCTNHNQRADNRTLANTSIWRVDPNSKLDAIMSLYPNAMVPASDGELEKLQMGANYPSSVEEEQLTLALARSRAGTDDPGFSGAGGDTVNKKGGLSAMGTFSVMQAGNRRVNLNITDMRYTHLKLGRKFLNQYAAFGIGERMQAFGEKAQYLKLALENVRSGKLILPIKAATASINKELEKQNDMLLSQVMQRHHQGIAQIMQAVSNPSIPPEMKQFFVGWIDSASIIMARILRNFGHDDISRLLPERKLVEGASNGAAGQGTNAGGGVTTNQGAVSVAQANSGAGGANAGMALAAGGGDPTAVPSVM